MMSRVVACTVVWCLVASLAMAEDRHFSKVFKRVMPRVENAVEVMDEGADLPDRALFGKDKRDLSEDINKLLDRAIGALGLSEASELRDGIIASEAGIRSARKALDELRRKRVSARDDALLGIEKMPFATTKKGYEERIAELEKRIAEQETELEKMQIAFREQLGSIGLQLNEAQAAQILSTVEGDQFIAMTVAFDNVKCITIELEQLMAASGEDPRAAKRYYGMYVVLLKILDRVQGAYIEEIDGDHLPKLADYEKEAESIIQEAEKLEKRANVENRRHLHANIASSETTIEAIQLYREYLKKQREAVNEMKGRLGQDITTAENTYRTVTLSTNLAALLRQGMDHFDALTRLTPPGLVVFQNTSVETEFRRLTERMKAP